MVTIETIINNILEGTHNYTTAKIEAKKSGVAINETIVKGARLKIEHALKDYREYLKAQDRLDQRRRS